MNTNPLSAPAAGALSGRLSGGVRLIATPLTIATFLLSGGTGLALFFDVHSRAIKELHEWSSIAMCGAVALHLFRNGRPTLALFRRGFTWVALGGAAITAAWMLVFAPASAGGRPARAGEGASGPGYGRTGGAAGSERGDERDHDVGHANGRGRGPHRERGDDRRD